MSITNEELTSGKLEGTGTFDLLISTMNAHLAAQFNKGHLTGPQYSEVYLGGMSTAMSQAIEFLLRRETTNKQNELLDEQIAQIKVQTDQLELQNLQIEEQTKQLVKQSQQIDAQTSLIEKQEEQVVLQNEQFALQNQQLAANTEQTEAQTRLIEKQIEVAAKEQIQLEKNIERTEEEIRLLEQQHLINEKTIEKASSEILLLQQKLITEQAQTQDEVGALKITGIIGKQASLYQAQTKGFEHDNKQKVAKIYSDIYSVARGTDNGVPLPFTPQSGQNTVRLNTELEDVLNNLKSSIE